MKKKERERERGKRRRSGGKGEDFTNFPNTCYLTIALN
jgi:hypothetical protein